MEPNPVLTPVLGAKDQFEFLAEEGMIRMGYPETSALIVASRRNRLLTPKSEDRLAGYEVIEAEAKIVQRVFQLYVVDGLSIGQVTRRLNEQGVATRKGSTRWGRSTIWAMLRNPAYRGMACFGKTQQAPRQRMTRTVRRRGGLPARNSAGRQLPREQWIEIPVPALVDEPTFALAQERLAVNRQLAARRTIEPSIVQGLVHCQRCGYALYRSSTRSSVRKISYYRCIGSDAWRFDGVARCEQRPIRVDLLEQVVWNEIVRLLEDPSLIQTELARRHEAARRAHPGRRHQAVLERDLAQVRKRMDRLLTAYQDELLTLDELRQRLPELRKRERSLQNDLQRLTASLDDDAAYLMLTETLTGFLERLRANGRELDIGQRQRVTRLLVKEIVVGDHNITIRHSIPVQTSSPPSGGHELGGGGTPRATSRPAGGYLLRPWRAGTTAGASRRMPRRSIEGHDRAGLERLLRNSCPPAHCAGAPRAARPRPTRLSLPQAPARWAHRAAPHAGGIDRPAGRAHSAPASYTATAITGAPNSPQRA